MASPPTSLPCFAPPTRMCLRLLIRQRQIQADSLAVPGNNGSLEQRVGHSFVPYLAHSPAREKFYVFQAFRDDMIDGLCYPLNPEKKAARNAEYDKRIRTPYAHYLKAFRKDRSLIHLADK